MIGADGAVSLSVVGVARIRTPTSATPVAKSDFRSLMTWLAGAEGLEPPACGFGDRRSTN